MVDYAEDGNNEIRRWSASRIIAAVILLFIIAGGLAYGIYSWTYNNTTHSTARASNSSSSNSGSTPPVPISSPTHNNGSSSSNVAAPNNGEGTSSTPVSTTPAPTATQLTNTGPGDTALIGFMVATVLGTVIHYRWRRIRQS